MEPRHAKTRRPRKVLRPAAWSEGLRALDLNDAERERIVAVARRVAGRDVLYPVLGKPLTYAVVRYRLDNLCREEDIYVLAELGVVDSGRSRRVFFTDALDEGRIHDTSGHLLTRALPHEPMRVGLAEAALKVCIEQACT
jgi:hypothetical protein